MLIMAQYNSLFVLYLMVGRLRDATRQTRMDKVHKSILDSGIYEHTNTELAFGAQLAWRNASRCIGRIQWSKLQVSTLVQPIRIPKLSVLTKLHLINSSLTDEAWKAWWTCMMLFVIIFAMLPMEVSSGISIALNEYDTKDYIHDVEVFKQHVPAFT